MAILKPLHFYMNFRIGLSIARKKHTRIFTVSVWNLQISLGRVDILTIPSLPIYGQIYLSIYLNFLNFSQQYFIYVFSLVQFSHSVVSDSLWPYGLYHTRLPCPTPTPGVCSNSCPSSWWYQPTISSFVIPFSSCIWSFPASGSFPMSQLFASVGQSIGASAAASVLPMNIQDWFPLECKYCLILKRI